MNLSESETQQLEQLISRHRVRRDDPLYRMGDQFENLYAIRLGHFKTFQINPGGEQQITGFQMAGELLGMDAIDTAYHFSDAVALEDSEVCKIPFATLEALFGQIPTLLRNFHRTMSHEITREQSVMLLLGNMRAEQKFAAFLLNLSSRYAARGYSSTTFKLRMSREDIGAYMGLTIESISRIFSSFRKKGWITVHNRDLEITISRAGLVELATGIKLAENDIGPSVSAHPLNGPRADRGDPASHPDAAHWP